jgi:glycosyltransferase involved in cell wall biosynthesis
MNDLNLPLNKINTQDQTFWPKISIVTPSFNQAQFIEETIRSVLMQNYPNLEYIIIDGGSTDGSVDIIKRYSPKLTYWISEADHGQSHAILKGFNRSTGEIMAWINSDDLYAPGALKKIALSASRHPETLWCAGRCDILEDGNIKPGWGWRGHGIEEWYMRSIVMQPAVFWRRNLWDENGGLSENLHYSFDYDLWLRFASVQPFPGRIATRLAFYRSHSTTKTSVHPDQFALEDHLIREKYSYLWGSRSVQLRLAQLIKKRKIGELIIEASKTESFSHRYKLIKQAISTRPKEILNPKLDFRILAALLKLGRS